MNRHIALSVLLLTPTSALAGGWEEWQTIDGFLEPNSAFGTACAWHGDHFLVSAIHDGSAVQPDTGGAWFYRMAAGVWLGTRLEPNDSMSGDEFGAAVASNGEFVFVGAPRHDASAPDAGAVYVFSVPHAFGLPMLVQKLVAHDAQAGDHFGVSLAADGDLLVVGCEGSDAHGTDSGAAYVFARIGASWTETARLVPLDAAAGDSVGRAVALEHGVALVSGSESDEQGDASGAAYAFGSDGAVWSQRWKFARADAAPGDRFGASLALAGDVAIVGAPDDDDAGADSGSAYVYRRQPAGWTLEQKLVASDGTAHARFATSLCASTDGVIAIGMPGDATWLAGAGAVYVYRRVSGAWSTQERLSVSIPWLVDRFGSSVAIDSCRIVAGAPERRGSTWPPAGGAALFRCRTPSTNFCAGDGSSGSCPCANHGLDWPGCGNSQYPFGGALSAEGIASVAHDSFDLDAFDIAAGPVLLLQSSALLANGTGVAFGNGLLCIARPITRVASMTQIDAHGWNYPYAGATPISAAGGVLAPGSRYYQAWYRDAAGFCTGAAFNLTNAITVRWIP